MAPEGAVLLAGLLGLALGSFANVAIHRLPRQLEARWRQEAAAVLGVAVPAGEAPPNLVAPPSHCPSCRAPIHPWHNIPLLSWLWLRGRCAQCKAPISPRYPLVEAAGALIAAASVATYGLTATAVAALACGLVLLVLAGIDWETQLLPDALTYPLLWLGLAVNSAGLFADLASAVWGAMAGYLLLWSIYHLFRWTTGKEGMGYGDFKLLAAIGAWVGWQQLPLVVLLSSVAGALVGVALILAGRHGRDRPLPFGPWLALAGWTVLLWGERLSGALWGSAP